MRPMSTLRFDDIDFPDGIGSDPGSLGWMQGSPPPQQTLQNEFEMFNWGGGSQ